MGVASDAAHTQPRFYYAALPTIPQSEVTLRIFVHEGWQSGNDVLRVVALLER